MHPRLPKGFHDALPDYAARRESLLEQIRSRFRLFGYLPIDTPIIEYESVLLGKGGGETDKQVYRFQDAGGRELALRFDLTIPLARFYAMHMSSLHLPFRRYHIGKVFRGENTQRGRYREFLQCDVDLLAAASVSSDFEIISLCIDTLRHLLTGDFILHLSYRSVLEDFLAEKAPAASVTALLRILDKLRKLSEARIMTQLQKYLPSDKITQILDFCTPETSNEQTLEKLTSYGADITLLSQCLEMATHTGISKYIRIDPSITRGLDYYTGMVFECFLTQTPDIGSVCSGGRYDSLTTLYTSQGVSGVGASIGLDRLLAAEEQNTAQGTLQIMIAHQDTQFLKEYHHIAVTLRSEGLVCEVYPLAHRLPRQFTYAEKKRIPHIIICGEREIRSQTCMLKTLHTRENSGPHLLKDIISIIKKIH